MNKLTLISIGSSAFVATLVGTAGLSYSAFASHKEDTGKKSLPTFAHDIAPIVNAKCVPCHRDGAGAPFSLQTYDQVKSRARLIQRVTQSRQMPPWKPGPSDYPLKDDISLTQQEINLISDWSKNGAPQGKLAEMPKAPKFSSEWALGKPDIVLKMPKAYKVPAGGPDIYRNFVLHTNIPNDFYIKAIDFRPGAKSVVHHCLYFYDSSGKARKRDGEDGMPGFNGEMGEFGGFDSDGTGKPTSGSIGGWAVGEQARTLPEDFAYEVPANADIILSTHFHPSGKAEEESSTLALYLAKKAPSRKFGVLLVPPVFGAVSGMHIKAGDNHYVLHDSYKLPVDVTAFGVMAHAHYLGKNISLKAKFPDGTNKELFSIPNWDFNWQGQYQFQHFVNLPKGTVLDATMIYDNSANNPFNPSNPPKEVWWGEQTTDEMGSVVLQVFTPNQADGKKLLNDYRKYLFGLFLKNGGPKER